MKKMFRGATALVLFFLTIGLSAGSAPPQSAARALKKLPGPERGFISSEPGQTWEQGLLSGNGTVGASVLGRPLDEIVVFSHKRMFVPERDPLLPPATATRLFEIRRLIDRRLFVSRADGIAVMRVSGPGLGGVSCRLELSPREPDNRRFKADVNNLAVTTDASTLTFRHGFVHAYAGSIQGLEGVLCRGQIEVNRLNWDGPIVRLPVRSAKAQDVLLYAPAEIKAFAVNKGAVSIRTLNDSKGRRLSLPAGQDVEVELQLSRR